MNKIDKTDRRNILDAFGVILDVLDNKDIEGVDLIIIGDLAKSIVKIIDHEKDSKVKPPVMNIR